jgi:hypothetical protein
LRLIIGILFFLSLLAPSVAETVEPRADQILRDMSNYLASLREFSFQVTTEFDEELGGRWVELGDTSNVYVQRPSHVRADRWGDKGRKQAYYNGQEFVIHSPEKNYYSVAPISGEIPDMLDFAHTELNMSLPVADFLFPDPYAVLTADVASGFYVGPSTLDGTACHHLAFQNNSGIEWQIWVEDGDMTVPRKFVIRHAKDPHAPRFSAVFNNWDADTPVPASMYDFVPPADCIEIPHRVREGK